MPGGRTGGGRGKPTAGDVAAAAGYSRTAVSFAFNSPDQLSRATRERILAVAEELGYRPSPLARMLRAGQTRALGVLLPQGLAAILRNPYYTEFLRGVGEVCDREGYTLLLTPPLRESMLEAIPYAAVDGFVVCGLETDRGEVAELARHRTPVVLVDGDPQSEAPGVDVDDRRGTREAVRHLVGLGHRRIAVLSFDPGPDTAVRGYRGPLARRLAGLADGLAEAGRTMADVELAEVPISRADGERTVRRWMAGPEPPTAILALSDILAFGALEALRDLGVDVPGEVSVVGFDDLAEAARTRPALTTVRQDVEAKGRTAAGALLAAIRGEQQPVRRLLPTRLVVRASTAPPPPPGRRAEAAARNRGDGPSGTP
ncbi:LacI family DNA-binding transcriptional regulator [Kitasatospora sp. NPDC085895]|uniref:LacI family DNA-binding transcriptional regulator n=1 Tax=Kitasatospora sp. NPDC085895 TaxID=3155057 RepID=UPI00345003BB